MTITAPDVEARKATRDGLLKVRETRSVPFGGFELREADNGSGGKVLNFDGYACRTEVGYEMQDWAGPYTEIVRKGAFTKTLSDGADVAFLVNHEGLTLARTKSGTLTLAEDNEGLHVAAQLDPTNPLVQQLRSAMERGDIDEMSFAFRCLRQKWSPDYEQRDILEVSIDKGDVSAVNYGANPTTAGATLRHRLPEGLTCRALAVAFAELRAGAMLSAANQATLQHVLDLASDADDAVDEIQVVLSDLLGVPNPDDPEPEVDEAKSADTLSLNRNTLLRLGIAV